MERSEQIGDLIAALAKAQGEFGAATKESKNPHFGSKYADLASNISAVRPALSKHGIALLQFDGSDLEHQTASVTTALHFGEQFVSVTAEAPAAGRNGFDVQTIGACWTYLRRYTLQAICGLASEDDDGETLAGNDNKPLPPKQVSAPKTGTPPAASQAKGAKEFTGVFEAVLDRLKCVPESVEDKTTSKGAPMIALTWNGKLDGLTWASCFDTKLFPALKAALGKECQIQLKQNARPGGDKYFTITDVLSVNGIEYLNGTPNNEFNQENPDADIPF